MGIRPRSIGVRARLTRAALALALGAVWSATACAKPPVAMELAIERGAPITASKEWYDLLTSLGVESLRIHSANGGEELKVEEVGPPRSPAYEVHGQIRANNNLLLPNGKFTLRDRAAIKQWIEKLGAGGVGAIAGQKSAFGLTPDQLRAVIADLRKPIDFSTTGLTVADLVKQLGQGRAFPLALETDAAKDAASAKIDDQLQGVSTGAGLAAALRPAGLVFLPQPSARGVVYRIGKPGAGTFWPIGVIPKQRNVEIAPKLLEMEDVEITDTPLPETLTAIRERLSLPFLFDYNAMATHGVEPAKVNITLPAKRLAYIQILQKVLFQAKLKAELRTDDAGKPFLWITTIKPAQ